MGLPSRGIRRTLKLALENVVEKPGPSSPVPVLILSKIEDLKATVERALAKCNVPRAALSLETLSTSDVHKITDKDREVLSSAQIILADPKLVVKVLPHAKSLQWLQSTFAGKSKF